MIPSLAPQYTALSNSKDLSLSPEKLHVCVCMHGGALQDAGAGVGVGVGVKGGAAGLIGTHTGASGGSVDLAFLCWEHERVVD